MGYQKGERHFRCVGSGGEHAFTKKGRPERDTINTAHKPAVLPDFKGMGVAAPVQGLIGPGDGGIDPCLFPGSATGKHPGKIVIESNVKLLFADATTQRARNMEMAEIENPPEMRIKPDKLCGIAAFSHREYAAGIGIKQQIGRQGFGHFR